MSKGFFQDLKKFSQEIFQSEDKNNTQNCPKIDTYIKRKISLSVTFQIHCSSPYAQALYRFSSVVVLQKRRAKAAQKNAKQNRFPREFKSAG